MSDLADRIQLGVLFLNDVHPGWAGQINLDELDLSDPSSCVLGQLFQKEADEVYPDAPFNGYTVGGFRLHDWLVKNEIYKEDEIGSAQELAGFERLGVYEPEWCDDTYESLQAEWVEVITTEVK